MIGILKLVDVQLLRFIDISKIPTMSNNNSVDCPYLNPIVETNPANLAIGGVILVICAVFAFVANIVIVAIYSRKNMRSPINTLLTGLALVEAILALWMIFWRGLLSLEVEPFVSRILFPLNAFYMTLHTVSVFFTVSLGLERYFAVCHFKKMNSKTAFIILGACLALSITINLPHAWVYEWHTNDNGTVCTALNVKFVSDNGKFLYYSSSIVQLIIPTLILIVTSMLIIKKIKRTNDTMEELTEISVNRKKEHRITKKLLAVILVFTVKSILIVTLKFFHMSNSNVLFASLCDLFVVLNCGVNIIIYGIYDENFRKIILSRYKDDKKTTVYTQVTKSH